MLLPLLVCAALSAIAGVWGVPWLRKLKTGQVVRDDGPQAHLKKAGTPTMGGLLFVPVSAIVAALWSGLAADAMAVAALTLAFGGLGWWDDWLILRKKSTKGVSPRLKLGLQIAVATLFCAWLFLSHPDATLTALNLPFGISFDLSWLFWPLVLFVFAAESNATNLTDGIDGLAAGTCAIALLGLGAIAAPVSADLTTFCACLSGGCLGFVIHNRNPAKVFMGDTGSLALGGALAAVGILAQNLWGLFLLSGIFFIESLSVIAQVWYFKATKGPDGVGKRLLKMAPLHHHLELSGWTETQIVGAFYAIALGLTLATVAIARIT
nr:phospho-N-acetylmuramoyl-pentapeptide-transferase [Rubidibacter lacunae]